MTNESENAPEFLTERVLVLLEERRRWRLVAAFHEPETQKELERIQRELDALFQRCTAVPEEDADKEYNLQSGGE